MIFKIVVQKRKHDFIVLWRKLLTFFGISLIKKGLNFY